MYTPSDHSGRLVGSSDSDFAGDLDDCKSRTGYVYFVIKCLLGAKNQNLPEANLSHFHCKIYLRK